ncbi:MAG: PQQ-dependent sugar dehydrogenase [Steroidobacteraceae bacterium]
MIRSMLWPAGVSAALVGCGGSGGNDGGTPPPTPGPVCSTGIETPRAFADLAFSSPVSMQQAPNDPSRWFVVEQSGRIFAFENAPDTDVAEEFVDLRDRVHREGEAGLLGMAFHPDFATNGLVYLNFSELVGAQLRSVTAEFTSPDGQTLDPASERILLRVNKGATNHNGGNIAFGPDGFLYIGLGDGGGSGDPLGNAQNPESLLGKMLRIDVDNPLVGEPYGIPTGAAGNPFAGNPLCNTDGSGTQPCPEIHALGFRNPWRWSFDSQSGDLWVGDVGQATWEEIDVVIRGGNYGWNIREGAHCFEPATGCQTQDLIDPVAEYGRDLGFSVTGGYVYRGLQTTQVAGNYVFGDFGGMIAWLEPDGAGGFNVQELVEQSCAPPGAPGRLQISSFAQDPDGELFVLDYDTGQILQLEFTQ